MNRRNYHSATSFMVSLCTHLLILVIISCVWVLGESASGIRLEVGSERSVNLDDISFQIVLNDLDDPLDQTAVELPEINLSEFEPELKAESLEFAPLGVEPIANSDVMISESSKVAKSVRSSSSSFFGLPPVGDRIVYIIDMSPSMQQGKYQRRFDRAVNEVLNSVDQLREDQEFFVIMFSFKTLLIRLERNSDFCFATQENKALLKKRLRSIGLSSGTDPREAIVAALKLKPSCIFLLSDGEFNGQLFRNGIYGNRIDALKLSVKHNRNKCPIHTIGLEDPSTQAELTEISAASGGKYVFVAAED